MHLLCFHEADPVVFREVFHDHDHYRVEGVEGLVVELPLAELYLLKEQQLCSAQKQMAPDELTVWDAGWKRRAPAGRPGSRIISNVGSTIWRSGSIGVSTGRGFRYH